MNDTFKFHHEYSIFEDSLSLAIIRKQYDGTRVFLQPFVWKAYAENTLVPRDEAFAIEGRFGADEVRQFLQAAMDAAWDMGLRPAQAKDRSDELASVRYHLEDMRKLAFESRLHQPQEQGT